MINNDAKIINGIKHSKNLTEKIKELVESEEVPKNVFLTSNLLHEKTVAFYFDALNRNY